VAVSEEHKEGHELTVVVGHCLLAFGPHPLSRP